MFLLETPIKFTMHDPGPSAVFVHLEQSPDSDGSAKESLRLLLPRLRTSKDSVSLISLLSLCLLSCLVDRTRTTREIKGRISKARGGGSFYRVLKLCANKEYK
jgi:hypothetical protein